MNLDDQPRLILFNDDIRYEEDEKVSMWVKDKDIISPSTNLVLLDKLEPGVYGVEFTRENGLFCKKIDFESDELYTFKDSITQSLLKEISTFWDKSEVYKSNNLLHKRGILLEGYPGTGKSSLISILSKEIISRGGVVFIVNGKRNFEEYVDFITTGFRKIQPDTPIITIIEDIDDYADSQVEPAVLDFLDGKMNIDHHVVIATTNNTEDIPDTFLRPSRIDLKIEIPLPCEETRREYFGYKNVPAEEIEKLVELTKDFSLADLKELYICIYLLDYSIDDAINKINSPRKKKNYINAHRKESSIGI